MDFVECDLDDAMTAYYHADGRLEVAGVCYDVPIVLGQNHGVLSIAKDSVADLTLEDFQAALAAGATLIIVGTGKRQQFLSPEVLAALVQRGVGVECMNTAAACRTLAMIQGEGRCVWAWLWAK